MTEHAKTHVRKRRKILAEKRRKVRLLVLALVLFLGSGALLFHKDKFYAISEVFSWLQQNHPVEITASVPSPVRGDIYDRNFRPLTATYKTYDIYARPLEMEDPDSSATLLAEILGLEKNELLPDLKSERGFIWIAKKIDHEKAEAIKQRNI